MWRRFHDLPWYIRYPAKCAAAAVLTLLVLYPKLWLLPTLVRRVNRLETLLDPTHPGLAELERDVRRRLPSDAPPRAVLDTVQQAVHEHLPYRWDWETWGVVEYLPTVGEALAKGHEDCDGRAIVAASLLRRMGYDAWLVSDLLHMWVETPLGATMNPTGGDKTLASGRAARQDAPTRWKVSLKVLRNLARGASYGVAVFPLLREAILIAGVCLIAMQPRSSVRRRVLGCLLTIPALLLVRATGQAAALAGSVGAVIGSAAGFLLALAAWLLLVVRDQGRPAQCAAGRPG